MLGLLIALYFAAAPYLGWIYLAGVAAVALLLVWEHSLVRANDLSRVNQAFFQVNAVISLGLFGVVLLQLVVGL
jgi:4-hydroxybenzoate polyprenyltransferase